MLCYYYYLYIMGIIVILFLLSIIILIIKINADIKCKNKYENMIVDNPINKHFKKIYVICIPSRKKYIQNVMEHMGLTPIYVDAILASSLPSLQILMENNVINEHFITRFLGSEKNINENDKYILGIKGKIALHLTLIHTMKLFLETYDDKCIVFEDDVLKPQNLNELFTRFKNIFENEIKNDYNMINMGRCYDLCEYNTFYSKNLVSNTRAMCTHAMIYDRKIANLIINSLPLYGGGIMSLLKQLLQIILLYIYLFHHHYSFKIIMKWVQL